MTPPPRTRSRRPLVVLLTITLLVLASGCRIGADDEMVPPTRTVTASPSPQAAAVPTTVPTGNGKVSPSDAVWAQDGSLHVGRARLDLSPRTIDSFVVVRGGVFFVDHGEVWFTDLFRVRDTGLRGVTRLTTNREASAMRVELAAGPGASTVAYDVRDGSSTSPGRAEPATVADRAGRPAQVRVRPERSDLTPATPAQPAPARLGPGRYGVLGGDGEPLVAFESASKVRTPLTGVIGNGFELVRWMSGTAVFGLVRAGARPLAVIRCDLAVGRCSTLGKVVAGRSLAFESGT